MARRTRKESVFHRSTNIAMPDDRALRLAVVADTHSKPHPAALDLIAREEPDTILHAGDIGKLEVLDALEEIAPVIAVRGNIDGVGQLPDSIDIALTADGACRLRLLLLHIALYGPKLRADAARLAREHESTVVVCGHSHVPFMGRDRGLTIFNPGSIGPRRFSLPILFGLATIGREGAKLEHISCETGERWHP